MQRCVYLSVLESNAAFGLTLGFTQIKTSLTIGDSGDRQQAAAKKQNPFPNAALQWMLRFVRVKRNVAIGDDPAGMTEKGRKQRILCHWEVFVSFLKCNATFAIHVCFRFYPFPGMSVASLMSSCASFASRYKTEMECSPCLLPLKTSSSSSSSNSPNVSRILYRAYPWFFSPSRSG